MEFLIWSWRCKSMSRIKQIQANMTVTGLFQTYPSPRWRLLEICALSPFGDLIYAVQMLRQMLLPSTNDWNAIIRDHAESDHPPSRRPLLLLRSHLLRLGFRADVRLVTTLVEAYAKSADLDSAQKAFHEMTHRDVAASNALICGFATGSRPHDALALFRRMCGGLRETRPNDITVVAALSACAQLGSLSDGTDVHAYAREVGMESNVRVCNALIDTYVKCGSLDRAVAVFERMPSRTLVTIKAFGYVAETSFVLHDIGEEEKENALGHHSEKLAIAYGLLRTHEGEEIVVHKNLRICGDCHVVAKLISRAYDRTIVIRDGAGARFHRFNGGSCSCGDYW
ncbi:Pentatricopeptide repeat-containing protein [Acorus calamus]|uniref:Pentatricopeptide repeat-containing protein n=1 Tax=Acorus calamus TaxID=4465 RepID=A0AAV9EL68_ACOCL|nr:Pentatricopeptide repeat-containing protein [Acorus calamus]